MESLGDILKRSTPINISREDTDTSLSADYENGEAVTSDLEVSCPICKGAGFVRRTVPFGHPDFGKAIPCQCTREEFEKGRLSRLQRYSNLGPLTRLTFENLIPGGRSSDPVNQEKFAQALAAARRFAQNPEGWLVLAGVSGCGKTHLAAAIANYCLAKGRPAFFIVVPDLLDHLRATFSPDSEFSYDELLEQVRDAPLLVLDDLGTQSSTPWAKEKLYQIINHRFNKQLPTVVTTNASASASLEELDERLRTRLTDPALSRVWVVEESRPPVLDHIGSLGLELLRNMSFENFDSKRVNLPPQQRQNLQQAFRLARNFAGSPEGWLVFLGVHGCGKTHLAAAIANYRLRSGEPVFFAVVPDLLDHLRSTFSPESRVTYDELFERVKKTPLLVLDDLGTQTSSSWAQEKLYQVINYRYNARLPTVITTVFALEEIETRLSSRMLDPSLSTVWNIDAPDYRGDRPPTEAPKGAVRRRRGR